MYTLNHPWLFPVEWGYEKISTAYRRGVIAGAYRRALIVSRIKDSSLLYLLTTSGWFLFKTTGKVKPAVVFQSRFLATQSMIERLPAGVYGREPTGEDLTPAPNGGDLAPCHNRLPAGHDYHTD